MPWSAAQAAGITLGDEKPDQRVRGRAVFPETTDMQISTCIDSEGTLVERAATKVLSLPIVAAYVGSDVDRSKIWVPFSPPVRRVKAAYLRASSQGIGTNAAAV